MQSNPNTCPPPPPKPIKLEMDVDELMIYKLPKQGALQCVFVVGEDEYTFFIKDVLVFDFLRGIQSYVK